MANDLTKLVMQNMCKEIYYDKEEQIKHKKYTNLKDYLNTGSNKKHIISQYDNNQKHNLKNVEDNFKEDIVKNINQEEILLLNEILSKSTEIKNTSKIKNIKNENKNVVTLDELRAIIKD